MKKRKNGTNRMRASGIIADRFCNQYRSLPRRKRLRPDGHMSAKKREAALDDATDSDEDGGGKAGVRVEANSMDVDEDGGGKAGVRVEANSMDVDEDLKEVTMGAMVGASGSKAGASGSKAAASGSKAGVTGKKKAAKGTKADAMGVAKDAPAGGEADSGLDGAAMASMERKEAWLVEHVDDHDFKESTLLKLLAATYQLRVSRMANMSSVEAGKAFGYLFKSTRGVSETAVTFCAFF